MSRTFITGSFTDILSFALEILIMRCFFEEIPDRPSYDGSWPARVRSFLPLILLLSIYMTPLNAAFSVFSIGNLGIQMGRMFLHLIPVMLWLLVRKECSYKTAAYLSGIFTAIYLTAQNLRMILMTYGVTVPLHQTTGTGYLAGVALVAAVEGLLAILTRRLIRPERINIIDTHRAVMMTIILLTMVYFKWILTAVRELSLGGDRIMMVSFSLVTSVGLYLVILLFDYSRLLLKEKESAERERTVLQYEIRSAEREMQAGEDIRRLYHDVKNHLLAIRSMAASESEIDAYLGQLLPQFEGYETQVRTGSRTVDAILSEKIQRSYPDNIRFNICLDLTGLDHIQPVDLVTIFGNAADNSIEALRKTEGSDRYVYIKSGRLSGSLIIRFQNRFSGSVEMKNGNPVTHKKDPDLHGIGIRSIRSAAERYGGSVSIRADNDTHEFTLVVMLPVSGAESKDT